MEIRNSGERQRTPWKKGAVSHKTKLDSSKCVYGNMYRGGDWAIGRERRLNKKKLRIEEVKSNVKKRRLS
jgi:hypothetical protein